MAIHTEDATPRFVVYGADNRRIGQYVGREPLRDWKRDVISAVDARVLVAEASTDEGDEPT